MTAVSASTMIEMRPREEMHERLTELLDFAELGDEARMFIGLSYVPLELREFDQVLEQLRFYFKWCNPDRPFPLERPDDSVVADLVERFVKLLIAALVADVEVQRALLRELMPSASVAPATA
jgi:hypothetical protein